MLSAAVLLLHAPLELELGSEAWLLLFALAAAAATGAGVDADEREGEATGGLPTAYLLMSSSMGNLTGLHDG